MTLNICLPQFNGFLLAQFKLNQMFCNIEQHIFPKWRFLFRQSSRVKHLRIVSYGRGQDPVSSFFHLHQFE